MSYVVPYKLNHTCTEHQGEFQHESGHVQEQQRMFKDLASHMCRNPTFMRKQGHYLIIIFMTLLSFMFS